MSLIETIEIALYGGAGAVFALGDWQTALGMALIAVAIGLARGSYS